MATKAMWEVDPETRSKVRRQGPVYIACPFGFWYANMLSSCNLVGRPPKGIKQQRVLRLRCPIATMGVSQVRHLHLPHVRRQASRPRRPHLLCPQRIDGCFQVGRD